MKDYIYFVCMKWNGEDYYLSHHFYKLKTSRSPFRESNQFFSNDIANAVKFFSKNDYGRSLNMLKSLKGNLYVVSFGSNYIEIDSEAFIKPEQIKYFISKNAFYMKKVLFEEYELFKEIIS